jgi:hypothetical protein
MPEQAPLAPAVVASPLVAAASRRPLLLLVEGTHDLEFLRRISRRLALDSPEIPDLAQLAAAGRIVCLPFGGGNPAAWGDRLAPLACAEVHFYDRELPPESDLRLRCAAHVNLRPGCRAFVTGKRSLENYLHPQAITAAGGGLLAFGDRDSVACLAAQTWYGNTPRACSWAELPHRSRARWIARAKRWLNTTAVEHMTAQRLAETDPAGEVWQWLSTIRTMLEGQGA